MKIRSADREGISARGRLAGTSGFGSAIVFYDLTPGGCRIADRSGVMPVGRRLSLEIDRLGLCRAQVRWNRNGEAGLSFEPAFEDMDFARLTGEEREASAPVPIEAPAPPPLPRRFC